MPMQANPIVARFLKTLFPHISRIFSAKIYEQGAKIAFWTVCTIFFVINILSLKQLPQSYDIYRKAILNAPFSVDSYIRFGQALFHQGNSSSAKKQIAVAQSTLPPSVLGTQTELQTVLSEWDYISGTKERTYGYWKQVTSTYPLYRDGFVQLAQASYDLRRFEETKEYLGLAESLDPNNALVETMRKEMGL